MTDNPRKAPTWAFALIIGGIAAFMSTTFVQALATLQWRETECTVVSRIERELQGVPQMYIRYRHVIGELEYMAVPNDGTADDLADRRGGERVRCWYDVESPAVVDLGRDNLSFGATLVWWMFVAGGAFFARSPMAPVRRTDDGARGRIVARNAQPLQLGVAVFVFAASLLVTSLVAASRSPIALWICLDVVAGFAVAYLVCGWLTRVELVVAALDLRPGQTLEATTLVHGPVAHYEIYGDFIGREVSQGADGSNPFIDARAFHKQFVEDARVPDDAPPSFTTTHQAIEWLVEVRAAIPLWPDVKLEIPLAVRGKLAERTPLDLAPAELPTESRAAIGLDGNRTRYQPGQPIAGTVGWNRRRAPTSARLHLGWTSTSRAVPPHRAIVDTVELARLLRLSPSVASSNPYRSMTTTEETTTLDEVERRRFRFVAPDAPYTFEGKLVQVRWFLRLEVDNELPFEVPVEIGA